MKTRFRVGGTVRGRLSSESVGDQYGYLRPRDGPAPTGPRATRPRAPAVPSAGRARAPLCAPLIARPTCPVSAPVRECPGSRRAAGRVARGRGVSPGGGAPGLARCVPRAARSTGKKILKPHTLRGHAHNNYLLTHAHTARHVTRQTRPARRGPQSDRPTPRDGHPPTALHYTRQSDRVRTPIHINHKQGRTAWRTPRPACLRPGPIAIIISRRLAPHRALPPGLPTSEPDLRPSGEGG